MALKRTTIKEVARAAGVSTQTVSRVLNERPDVAPETRQRVLAVIAELGFQPSFLARSLIHQRSLTIGVVAAGLRYMGPSLTLNGISEQAEAMGYVLTLKELPRFDTQTVEPILRDLIARQVDGIIWAVPEAGDNRSWLQALLPTLPMPIVFLSMHEMPGVTVVANDNRLGGRLATEHLIAQGRRKIGHIAGPLVWWEARERKAGWEDALARGGPAGGVQSDCGRGLDLGQQRPSLRPAHRAVPGFGRCLCGKRPNGAQRAAPGQPGRPPDPGGAGRSRLRRHPRSRLLFPAADDHPARCA